MAGEVLEGGVLVAGLDAAAAVVVAAESFVVADSTGVVGVEQALSRTTVDKTDAVSRCLRVDSRGSPWRGVGLVMVGSSSCRGGCFDPSLPMPVRCGRSVHVGH